MATRAEVRRFRRAQRAASILLTDRGLHSLAPLEPRVLLTTLSVIATDPKAAESGNPPTDKGTITFMLDAPAANDIQIDYDVTGTATSGKDFTALPGGITILQGQKSATLTISPIDDNEKEDPETVIVSTDGAVGVTLNQSKKSATVTIADNEPTIGVTATKAAASETNPSTAGKGTFTFTRTGGSTAQDQLIDFELGGTATPTTDFTFSNNVTDRGGGVFSITIPATKTSVAFDLIPVSDAIADSGETVIVMPDVIMASDGMGGTFPTYGLDPKKSTATVTISDNAPVVSITKAKDASETNPATTGQGHFTIMRTGPTTAPMTVRFSVGGTATNPDDYALSTTAAGGLGTDNGFTTVTIPAGKSSVTVDLTPVDDAVADFGETVVLTLAQDAAFTYNVSPAKGAATATIVDNEPTVEVKASKANASETNPATGGKGTFTFTRSVGPSNVDLTVHYTVTGTATATDDYAALPGTVIIPAGKNSVTVDVIPVDDTIAEPTETVVVTLDADTHYNIKAGKESGTVNIADNEPTITVTASKANASETSPATTGKGTFTFTRAGGSTASDLTVHYTVAGTATPVDDYPALAGTVIIPAGKASVTVDVVPVNDALVEPAETVIVNLAADAAYHLSPMPAKLTATVTIADNEPTVSISKTKDASEASGDTTGKGTFTVTRASGDTSTDLTVHYTVSNTSTANSGADYQALSGMVVIPAGKTTATIDVIALADTQIDPNETVVVNLSADPSYRLDASAAKQTATVKITDVPAIQLLETLGLDAAGSTWHYNATLHNGHTATADATDTALDANSWKFAFNITPDNPADTALSPSLTVARTGNTVKLVSVGVNVDGDDVAIDFADLTLGGTVFAGSNKDSSPIAINLLGSTLNGNATATTTLVSTQQTTVPAGTFQTAKMTLAITFSASGLLDLGLGKGPVNVTVSGNVTFTFFAATGAGIVKLTNTGGVNVAVPGLGSMPLNLGLAAELQSVNFVAPM